LKYANYITRANDSMADVRYFLVKMVQKSYSNTQKYCSSKLNLKNLHVLRRFALIIGLFRLLNYCNIDPDEVFVREVPSR